MATLTPLTVGNAAAPSGWTSAPNGALGDNSDATYGYDSQNSTHSADQGWELGNVDADFSTMATLAVVLRYAWQTGTQVNTWDTLACRVMNGATVLAAADAGGTFKTVASSITTSTPTNSGSTAFDYVNTTADKTAWDAAVVEIRISITKNKGGDALQNRVYEADLTGTYNASANVTVTPTTASLTTATFAPTVLVSNNQTVTPGVASLTLATFAPTVTDSRGILIVGDKTALTTLDSTVKSRLEGLGYTVDVRSDEDAEGSVAGYAFVVVVDSTSGATFSNKYETVSIPVLYLDNVPAINGDLATATFAAPQVTQVSILDDTHPADAGLTGTVTVGTGAGVIASNRDIAGWTAAAWPYISLTTDANAIVAATYNPGDTMQNAHVAEGRRAYLGLHWESTQANNNENSYLLIDSLVAWAVSAESASVTVTPSTATLTTSAFAPTVTASDHQTVTPTTASLALSAFAPTAQITDHQLVTPSTAALTLSPLAPTVTATANQTVTPGTAALSLATFAPTVTGGAGLTVTPTPASLALTAFAPSVTVSDHVTVTPTTASLSLTAFAPSAVLSDHQTVTPTTASLSLSTFAPTVTGGEGLTIVPTTASLSLTAFAPDVVLTDHVTVTPTTASLTLTAFAPSVTASDHQTVTPSTASLSLATFAPTVTGGAGVTVTPSTASLTLASFAPVVTASADIVTGGAGPTVVFAVQASPTAVVARPVPRGY